MFICCCVKFLSSFSWNIWLITLYCFYTEMYTSAARMTPIVQLCIWFRKMMLVPCRLLFLKTLIEYCRLHGCFTYLWCLYLRETTFLFLKKKLLISEVRLCKYAKAKFSVCVDFCVLKERSTLKELQNKTIFFEFSSLVSSFLNPFSQSPGLEEAFLA